MPGTPPTPPLGGVQPGLADIPPTCQSPSGVVSGRLAPLLSGVPVAVKTVGELVDRSQEKSRITVREVMKPRL